VIFCICDITDLTRVKSNCGFCLYWGYGHCGGAVGH